MPDPTEYQSLGIQVSMESNRPPRKVCPQCDATLHAKRAACGCGHAFPSKRQKKDRLHKETKRALETGQTIKLGQEKDRLRKESKRASEMPQQTLHRQENDRLGKESKRASEMPQQTLHRQENDRLGKESKRASEMLQQTLRRQEKDRLGKESKRASEMPQQTLHRQEKDRLGKESKRASEMPQQTLHRQEKDRLGKESKRASEMPQQTLHRQEKDRLGKESRRVCETPDEFLHRKQTNKECVSNRRKRCVPLKNSISVFHSDVKSGPDFVCTCCHRMMYRKNVVQCNKTKYTKACLDVLEKVFSADLSHISIDGREWMCKTCDRFLMRGSLPLQAKANGLQLSEVPPELCGLNALELRLISLRVPFMKMVALPSGKQRSIHGPAVNVPSKVDVICDVLPRYPSQLIPLKLKRKIAYRSHYMYDYVRPQKVLGALRYLKAKNPLYADIDVNEQWFEEAMDDSEELCKYLVEQDDDSMDIECEKPENDGCCAFNAVMNVGSEPVDFFGDSNEFLMAVGQLKTLARVNGFNIHEVPCDGNCMFSAVSYQLKNSGVCSADSNEIRQNVADHLEANSAFYRDFLCQPVPSAGDVYNADTEQLTAEDEYIDSVADPHLKAELRWQKYVRCLRQGAWGDHITMQAIADMLSVKISVLSSNHPMFSVTPGCCSAECEIFVGLIMQYHYVGLDKLPVCGASVQQSGESATSVSEQSSTNSESAPVADESLDDATIEKGDEHRVQISGAPMATMMCVESPESFREIICVAPAEGEKPLSIMTDSNFEAMSNPDKFPFANGMFSSERSKKLTYRKYFNQRLLDVDGRFARDLDYLFVAQYIVEVKQVLDDGNNFAWRQNPLDNSLQHKLEIRRC